MLHEHHVIYSVRYYPRTGGSACTVGFFLHHSIFSKIYYKHAVYSEKFALMHSVNFQAQNEL